MEDAWLFTRWHTLGATLLLTGVAGTTYAFGVYSEDIEDILGYSGSDLSVISSVGAVGLYCGGFTGHVIHEYGPRFTVLMGCVFSFVGFFLMYLCLQKIIPSSVGALSLMLFVGQVGTCCFSQVCTVVSIQNFPAYKRAQAAGIGKAFFGLSSAVLAQVSEGLFLGNGTAFLLFLSIFLPGVGLITQTQINVLPSKYVSFEYEKQRGYSTSFRLWYILIGFLMVFLLVVGYLEDTYSIPLQDRIWLTAVTLALLSSVAVLSLLQGGVFVDTYVKAQLLMTEQDGSEEPLLSIMDSDSSSALAGDSVQTRTDIPKDGVSYYGPDLTLMEAIFTVKYWLLAFVFTCAAGSGLTVINNIQTIAEALGHDTSSFFVTVISIANCVGRVVTGYLSDRYSYCFPRLAYLAAVMALMAATNALLAVGHIGAMDSEFLEFCFILMGLCYGSMFCLIPTLCGDIWGPKYVGSVYGALDLCPATGSFVFSLGIFTVFYGSGDCIGVECVRGTFICTGVCCVVAAAVCVYLHRSTTFAPIR